MKLTASLSAIAACSLALATSLPATTIIGPTAAFDTNIDLLAPEDSITAIASVTISAVPDGPADTRLGFFDAATNPAGYWAELDVQSSSPTLLKLLIKKDTATDTSALAGDSETLDSINLPITEFTSNADLDTILLDATYRLTFTITGVSATEVTLLAELSRDGVPIVSLSINDDTDGLSSFASWALRDEAEVAYTESDTIEISGSGTAADIDVSTPLFEAPIDTQAPAVTINQASGQADPTTDSPIAFTAVFSEMVTGFDSDDVILSGTAGATTVSIQEDVSGTTYTVNVAGMSNEGTVVAEIGTAAAQDASGNDSLASTSDDNTVTFTVVVDPPAPSDPFLTMNGMAVMEAEHYDTHVAVGEFRWETSDIKPNALGGLAMQALPNVGEKVDDDDADEDSPVLCYHVHFEEPGRYTLWVRMLGETPSDDSLHGGLNDRVTSKHIAPEALDTWEWEVFDKQLKVKEAGVQEVCLWMREDGTFVDQLVVTLDDDFVPGDDLIESERGTPSDGPPPTDDDTPDEPVAGDPFVESNGLIVIEAEQYHDQQAQGDHQWISDPTQEGFLGETALVSRPNVGARIRKSITESSPKLTYLVNLPNEGRYRVWVRGLGLSGSDNSIHVGFDGEPDDDHLAFDGGDGWEWVSEKVKASAAGTQEFCIWMREDGTYIDQIVLTQRDDFTPSADQIDGGQSKETASDEEPNDSTVIPNETENDNQEEEDTPNTLTEDQPIDGDAPAAPQAPLDQPAEPDLAAEEPIVDEEEEDVQLSDAESVVAAAREAFSQWQEDLFTAAERSQPEISDLSADADGDGLTNLEDFAFGMDPHRADASPLAITEANGRLELRYPESSEAAEWRFIVEHSTDMVHWKAVEGWDRQITSENGNAKHILLRRWLDASEPGTVRRGYYRVCITSGGDPMDNLPE